MRSGLAVTAAGRIVRLLPVGGAGSAVAGPAMEEEEGMLEVVLTIDASLVLSPPSPHTNLYSPPPPPPLRITDPHRTEAGPGAVGGGGGGGRWAPE